MYDMAFQLPVSKRKSVDSRLLVDENELSNEDLDALEDGLAYVRSVVGDDCPVPDIEIKEALWYYYFDREETVNWVLGKITGFSCADRGRYIAYLYIFTRKSI